MMFRKIVNKIGLFLNRNNRYSNLKFEIKSIHNSLQELKILEGKQLGIQNISRTNEILNELNKAEFKVFSQWGDDGIMQFLIDYLNIENKIFIEFGVEDYLESNTRFILINNCWKGLVMDGSALKVNQIKCSDLFWQYQLDAICCFITRDNINELISEYLNKQTPGILVIDVDGNDYWIWEAIEVKPTLVVVEYNSLLGFDRAISIPYHSNFVRNQAHYSNLYYGASLPALCQLANKKGYTLVGCNSNGNNAYFVRNDKLKDLKAATVEKAFNESSFRESRNEQNKLTYLNYNEAFKIIKGLKVVNVETLKEEII